MDLGSLNNTRKLSQDVLDNRQRVERVRHKRNRRNLFIENKTDARRSIALFTGDRSSLFMNSGTVATVTFSNRNGQILQRHY